MFKKNLQRLVDGAAQNVELLFAGEFHEVDGVARDADCELRVFFGMCHCVNEEFAVKDVDIQMMSAVGREIAVHQ